MDLPPQKQPNNILLIAFLGTMGLVLIVALVLIIKSIKPAPVNNSSKPTRDSIILLTTQIEEQKKITDHYLGVVDSMKALPPTIKIIYREQKNFTYAASASQSDSIIRNCTGLKARLNKVL